MDGSLQPEAVPKINNDSTMKPVRASLEVTIMKNVLFVALLLVSASFAHAGGKIKTQNWNECYKDLAAEFTADGLPVRYECTQVNVPLDYDRPNGPVISLAVVRIPASHSAVYRGSLFLNPGGPGGSGVDFALFFGPLAPLFFQQSGTQYDIVGFDPRGIGRSTALKCFGNEKQSVQVFAPVPFPEVAGEVPFFEAGDNLLNDQCSTRGNKIVDHMSTANVARDLEYMRQAFGDTQMNFLGLSYGSYLGQTYANLFPNTVGALIIDGVLDPIAWSNVGSGVPFSTALRSDLGAEDTLAEFLRQCEEAGPSLCALAPDAENRFNAVLARLQAAPIPILIPGTGDIFQYRRSFFVADLLGNLYNPSNFPLIADFVAFLESIPSPAALGLARQNLQSSPGFVNKRGFPNYENFAEGFPAVACEDSQNPGGGHPTWFAVGQAALSDAPVFGEIWTWASSPCAVWSSFDNGVYRGPYNADTANPVLIIGNLYDPATRYEGAQAARALLPNSGLLTVDEPGHTSLGLSFCAAVITDAYLQDPQVALLIESFGFSCPSEGNWFEKLAPAAAGDGASLGAEFRARMMSEIAFSP